MRGLLIACLLPFAATAQEDPFADDGWDDSGWEEPARGVAGFAEIAAGGRLSGDPLLAERLTLGDLRLRLESEWHPAGATLALKVDLDHDAVENEWDGELREATLAFAVGDSIDVKAGRQVLTWGTGDLLFLNDLFPKDFESFFAGRDDEYLKAPGNAIRVTRYGDALNVDFAWSPVFDSDVYLDGERFSFFSPRTGGNIAPQPPLDAVEPDESLAHGEYALRLFRTVGSRELALYGYRGFFKQPTAANANGEPTFAPLSAVGASLRQPAGPGLFNAEFAWYLSRDDRDGADPRIPNDQLRILAGYEWEARPRLTVGLQYYLEATRDHGALLANSPAPEFEPDEYRHLLTNRLTWRSARERHTLSLFTFFSPSDADFYLRPAWTYRHSDTWTLTTGASLFGGDEPQTFFNQLRDASNLYIRLRYNF